MGIGGSSHAPHAPQRRRKSRPALIAGIGALVVLLALDIPALHALDEPWPFSAGVGAVWAVVGAGLAFTWFGSGSKAALEDYFWKRLLALGVFAVVFTPIVYFVMGWPVLPSVAVGVDLAVLAGLAFMAAMGDL